jgi:aminoglycoside 6'-N-acetyltransferase I
MREGSVRRATSGDIPTLTDLMADFYAESGHRLDRAAAAAAFGAVLADERLGHVWLVEDGGTAVGHLVVAYRFGMEYSGLIACVDDLYVRPAHRNRGLATAALVHVKACCEAAGVRALTVEADPDGGAAWAVYRRVGLAEAPGRRVLALPLAAPPDAG